MVSLGLVLALGQPSSAVVRPSTPAVAAGSWVGTATNPDGTFNYGAVRFTVRGATVRNFVIEGVTTDCGYMSLVMDSMKIKGNMKKATIFTPDLFPKPTDEQIAQAEAAFKTKQKL